MKFKTKFSALNKTEMKTVKGGSCDNTIVSSCCRWNPVQPPKIEQKK